MIKRTSFLVLCLSVSSCANGSDTDSIAQGSQSVGESVEVSAAEPLSAASDSNGIAPRGANAAELAPEFHNPYLSMAGAPITDFDGDTAQPQGPNDIYWCTYKSNINKFGYFYQWLRYGVWRSACCASTCGGCWHSGCSWRPGGTSACCPNYIYENGRRCKDGDPACGFR